MKRLLFIYNPGAGKGKIRPVFCDLIQIFASAGYRVTVMPTRGAGDVQEEIRRQGMLFDCIVLCGGDGTLHEGVNGYVQALQTGDRLPPLGYLPAGTTNDYAYSLQIPFQLKRAAKKIMDGKPFYCDAGQFNDRCFAYVAAFGAFTEVAYSTPRQSKQAFGHLAYVMEGIKQLPAIKGIPMTVRCNGEIFSDRYLYGMVSNTTSLGGFRGLNRQGRILLNDGRFEVILVREPETLADRSTLMTDLLTLNLDSRWLKVIQTNRVEFVSPAPVPWTLDGEFGGDCQKTEVSVLRRILPILL